MKIWAFVPAGGVGARMQSTTPKQYLTIDGREIVRHAIERLGSHSQVAGVVVGVAADDRWFGEMENLPIHAVTRAGKERAHTVFGGLSALVEFADASDLVLVHDAVRPLVRSLDIDRLIDKGAHDEHGALLAMPICDTVKHADDQGRVDATVERNRLWRAATPQLFRIGLLHDALRTSLEEGFALTDEAAAMERLGYHPALVECASDNIKITQPSDLPLAQWLYTQQGLET